MMSLKRRGKYGIDAPKTVILFSCISGLLMMTSVASIYIGYTTWPWITGFVAFSLISSSLSMLYPVVTILLGSLKLKFRECNWLLDSLNFKGNEFVLDIGCGSGLLLIGAAKKLTTGKAIGIDIWTFDQSNNTRSRTLQNAQLEFVQDKIEVFTMDITNTTFADASFDIIISGWVLHNISEHAKRQSALYEINRILKPGGKIALMDIQITHEYEAFFKKHGFMNISVLGPRYTFGIPTYLVKATKNTH